MTETPPKTPAAPKTRAQLLQEQGHTIAPPATVPKKCFWCGHGRAPRYRRGQHIGIIVERRGTLDMHIIRESAVQARSGCYMAECVGFHVERTIPKGSRITIWPEGDPEPFTTREPRGYGAGYLARILGGSLSHAFKGAFATKGLPLSRGARIGLLIAGLLAAVGLAFLWFQRHGG